MLEPHITPIYSNVNMVSIYIILCLDEIVCRLCLYAGGLDQADFLSTKCTKQRISTYIGHLQIILDRNKHGEGIVFVGVEQQPLHAKKTCSHIYNIDVYI